MKKNETSSISSENFSEADEKEYSQISDYMYKMASKIVGKPNSVVQDTKNQIEYLKGLLNSTTSDKEKVELQSQIAQLDDDLIIYQDAIKYDALNKVYNANVGLLTMSRKSLIFEKRGMQSRVLEEKIDDAIQDGLMYSIKNFDPEKGYKFSTYAMSIIKNFARTAIDKYYAKEKNDPLVSPNLKYFEDSIGRTKDGDDINLGKILPDEDEEIYRLEKMFAEDYNGIFNRAMQYFSEKDERLFVLNKIEGISCRDIIKKCNLNISHQAVYQKIQATSRELTQLLTRAKAVGEMVSGGESFSNVAKKLNFKKEEDALLWYRKYRHIFLGYACPVPRKTSYTTYQETQLENKNSSPNIAKPEEPKQPSNFVIGNSIYEVKDKPELNETQKLLVYLLGKDYDFSKFKKSVTVDDILSFFNEKEVPILCHAINEPINKEFVESMGVTKEIIYSRIRYARSSFQKLIDECEESKNYSDADVKTIIKQSGVYNEFINSSPKAKKFYAYATFFKGIKRPDIDEKAEQIEKTRKEIKEAILGAKLVKMLTYTRVMPENEKRELIKMADGLNINKLLSFLPKTYADMMSSEESLIAKARQLQNEGVKCGYGSLRNERARACRYLTNLLTTSNNVDYELKLQNDLVAVGAKLGLTSTRVNYYKSVYDYLYNGKKEVSNNAFEEGDFVDNIGTIKETSFKNYREDILENIKKMEEVPAKKMQFINKAFGVTAESSPGTFKILNKVDFSKLFQSLDKNLTFQFGIYLDENPQVMANILRSTPEEIEEAVKEQSHIIARKIMICNSIIQNMAYGERLDSLSERSGIGIKELQKYKTLALQIFPEANNEIFANGDVKKLENVKQTEAFTKEWEKKVKVLHLLNLIPAYFNGEIVRDNASVDNFITYFENVEDYTALNNLMLKTLKLISSEENMTKEEKQEFHKNAMRVISSSKIDDKVHYLGSKSKEEVIDLAILKKKAVAYEGFYELFLQDASKQHSIENTAEEKALRLIFLLYDRVDTDINFELIYKLQEVEISDILKLLKSDKDKFMAQKYLDLKNITSYGADGSIHNFKTRTRNELRKKLQAIYERLNAHNSNLSIKEVLELVNVSEVASEK